MRVEPTHIYLVKPDLHTNTCQFLSAFLEIAYLFTLFLYLIFTGSPFAFILLFYIFVTLAHAFLFMVFDSKCERINIICAEKKYDPVTHTTTHRQKMKINNEYLMHKIRQYARLL